MAGEGFEMALVKCPDCQADVSDNADACPSCGYSLKRDRIAKRREGRIRNTIIGFILFVAFCIFLLFITTRG
jgi:predicted amidophosphoribosyltransferase